MLSLTDLYVWWIRFYSTNVLMYVCMYVCDYRLYVYVECLASASHIGGYLWLIICFINNILYNQCIDVCDCTIESLSLVYIWNKPCNDVSQL